MRIVERAGRLKREPDYQVLPKASKTAGFGPPTAGVDVLLETARQKRAYAIRGL